MKNKTPFLGSDIIIHLSVSVGGQGSISYQLSIFTDGSYRYNNTSNRRLNVYNTENKTSIDFVDENKVLEILNFARAINFSEICCNNPFPPQVKNSIQRITIFVKDERVNGQTKDEVSFLTSNTPKEILELRTIILKSIEEDPYK